MSTLYIRLPAKAAAENAEHWTGFPCPFALAANNGQIEREGVEPLSTLSSLVAASQRVVLILAASDVSVLRVQVPPMSPARMKAALPNLVEEQLISDPADCVIVAANDAGMRSGAAGVRTVAVVQKAWLDLLMGSLLAAGARNLSALPAQLCLPYEAGMVSAAVAQHGSDVDLALRLDQHEGIGVPILIEDPARSADDVIATLLAVTPQASVILRVPQADVVACEQAVQARNASDRVSVRADDWRYWIAGSRDADAAALNLMTGTGMASRPAFDWRAWRVPLGLAAAVLLVNVLALNIDWWRMRSDANSLRTTMTQIFRSAFPKEPIVLDPVAQMRQKLAASRRGGGEAAPDDFLALAAGFGDAWNAAGSAAAGSGKGAGANAAANVTVGGPETAVSGLEYKDRVLLVKFKSGVQPPEDRMKSALAARELALTPAPAQGGAPVWQIRSGK